MSDLHPTGGQLLGRLVWAFDLRHAVGAPARKVVGKSGQRFFAAGRNVQHTCGLVHVFGYVLAGTPLCNCAASSKLPQMFKPLLFRERPSLELSRYLVLSAHTHALAWDRLVRPKLEKEPDLLRAFVRFGVLDLAVKTAHLRVHDTAPAPTPGALPAWADPKRLGEPLRQLTDRRRRGRSLERIAEAAKHPTRSSGVSIDALKRWRRGQRRPNDENLAALIAAVGVPKAEQAKAQAEISRHYALAALARELRRAFGEPFLRELVDVYSDAVACRMAMLGRVVPDYADVRETFDVFTLAFSSVYFPGEVFVGIAEHHAPSWVDDISRATAIWSLHVDRSMSRQLAMLNWCAAMHDQPPITAEMIEAMLASSDRTEGEIVVDGGPTARSDGAVR